MAWIILFNFRVLIIKQYFMSTVEFNELLLNNTEFLKPFAVTLTRDNEVAKDLLQETMYRALINKEKYNVGTNIKAWLYTIMRNIFINNYRRKSKQNTIFDNSPNEFLLDHNQSAVPNGAETSMRMKDINKAIHELPTIFKQPFMLNFPGWVKKQSSLVAGSQDSPLPHSWPRLGGK